MINILNTFLKITTHFRKIDLFCNGNRQDVGHGSTASGLDSHGPATWRHVQCVPCRQQTEQLMSNALTRLWIFVTCSFHDRAFARSFQPEAVPIFCTGRADNRSNHWLNLTPGQFSRENNYTVTIQIYTVGTWGWALTYFWIVGPGSEILIRAEVQGQEACWRGYWVGIYLNYHQLQFKSTQLCMILCCSLRWGVAARFFWCLSLLGERFYVLFVP